MLKRPREDDFGYGSWMCWFFKFYPNHLTEAENNIIGSTFFLDNMSKFIYKTSENRHSNFGWEDKFCR